MPKGKSDRQTRWMNGRVDLKAARISRKKKGNVKKSVCFSFYFRVPERRKEKDWNVGQNSGEIPPAAAVA